MKWRSRGFLTGAPRMRDPSRPGDNASGGWGPAGRGGVHSPPWCSSAGTASTIAEWTRSLGARSVCDAGIEQPLFHDRFVVIDDIAWASGPSFNELGEQIGLIGRFKAPAVIAAIERAIGQSQSLADWITKFENVDPQIGGPDAAGV